jgi:hypothetical protein
VSLDESIARVTALGDALLVALEAEDLAVVAELVEQRAEAVAILRERAESADPEERAALRAAWDRLLVADASLRENFGRRCAEARAGLERTPSRRTGSDLYATPSSSCCDRHA